jgi:hypothetical protein
MFESIVEPEPRREADFLCEAMDREPGAIP